ncbi:MAG: hypothetical protein P8X82_13500 [Gemmatimonadales bacterium]
MGILAFRVVSSLGLCSRDAGGDVAIGLVVLNLTQGEVVSVSGRSLDDIDDLACSVLT